MDKRQAKINLQKLVDDERLLRLDEKILDRYLNFSNGDVAKAFAKMKSVYLSKKENKKWFATELYTEAQKKALARGVHCLLPLRDQLGRRVYVLRLGRVVVGEIEPWEMFQVDDFFLELAMDEEETQENGLIFIIDMKNISWKYVTYFTPGNCKTGSNKAENLPIKNIQFHVVNSGILLNTLVTILFPFLSNATKGNIFFHKSNMASLHQHVTNEILPKDYDGNQPSMDPKMAQQLFLDNNINRLKELISFGYDDEQISKTIIV